MKKTKGELAGDGSKHHRRVAKHFVLKPVVKPFEDVLVEIAKKEEAAAKGKAMENELTTRKSVLPAFHCDFCKSPHLGIDMDLHIVESGGGDDDGRRMLCPKCSAIMKSGEGPRPAEQIEKDMADVRRALVKGYGVGKPGKVAEVLDWYAELHAERLDRI